MHAARMVREAEGKVCLECYKNENKLRSTEERKKRDQGKNSVRLVSEKYSYALFKYSAYIYNNILA